MHYIFPISTPAATKLGMVQVYNEDFPSIKSQDLPRLPEKLDLLYLCYHKTYGH